jgi:hypothetical protein
LQNRPGQQLRDVAGDLDTHIAKSIERLANVPILKEKPVLFVPGNHEFDGSIVQDNLDAGFGALIGRRNIQILHRRTGKALWSEAFKLGRITT